ncbi:hypothetical protein N825_23575 [Skermanella stibiiresistens SB22]|uniref:DUF5666 domain-containing protein n=1 Tax=Skermanella stibiiresistens SB22 TaxID=1385369 RepID=W9HAU7_9PROT|nr:hypothetical protein [Skermanella stibiiresistens]EWY41822.1 hypothetical protein N825_23575 [Skermanella stibiiresistens SB22]
MSKRLGLASSRIAVGLTLAVAAGTAAAQTTTMTTKADQPVTVQGEISGIEANHLTVKTRDGETRLTLASDARILSLTKSNAEAVASDSFIGAAGTSEKEEMIKAKVVVIYPKGSSGVSDDYLTWDMSSDSKMRNGTVQSIENGPDGRVIGLKYPQGGATVIIPSSASVMAAAPADRKTLKKGDHIFVPSADKADDGSLSTDMVAVGADGFDPQLQ